MLNFYFHSSHTHIRLESTTLSVFRLPEWVSNMHERWLTHSTASFRSTGCTYSGRHFGGDHVEDPPINLGVLA